MKEKDFNVNNSNKLIIGVSILFCTVILIIGASTAYFTQGAGANIENIVTADELSLEYNDDDNNYMRQELIPASRENAVYAYNIEGENKCKDDYDYSVCSIYRFSVENTGNVPQLLRMSLHPTANSYKNLKFMLYEVAEGGNILIKDTTDLEQFSVEPIIMSEAYTLGITNENEEKTFELVLYIEAQDYDQTSEDSGKQFGAGIRIDSITTGKYIAEGFGPNCWETDLKDRTTLVKFNGIDHETGEVDEKCSAYVTKEGDYYSINVPSNIGGQEITTLGNSLFGSVASLDNEGNPTFNKYVNIKAITISEGIKEIADGNTDNFLGTFIGIGIMYMEDDNYNLDISFPNSLVDIGVFAFGTSNIKKINIPSSVVNIKDYAFVSSFLNEVNFLKTSEGKTNLKTIGDNSFSYNSLSSIEIPESIEKIGDNAFEESGLTKVTFLGSEYGTSNLESIGEKAFFNCDLMYETVDEPLILPSSLKFIGDQAFRPGWANFVALKYIKFMGTRENLNKLGTNWYSTSRVLQVSAIDD